MSGRLKAAKQALGCPLDGRVGRLLPEAEHLTAFAQGKDEPDEGSGVELDRSRQDERELPDKHGAGEENADTRDVRDRNAQRHQLTEPPPHQPRCSDGEQTLDCSHTAHEHC